MSVGGHGPHLLLEADDASAVAMFESLLGRIPVSERELIDFLAERIPPLIEANHLKCSKAGKAAS